MGGVCASLTCKYIRLVTNILICAKEFRWRGLDARNRRFCFLSVIPKLPIPIVEDILGELDKSKVFSTLDLVSGFFQCSLDEDSIPITAVITSMGLYGFKSVLQGLSSTPGWFHSVMARVCERTCTSVH